MFCPACGTEYPADWKVCPKDASLLLATLDVGRHRIEQLGRTGPWGPTYRARDRHTGARADLVRIAIDFDDETLARVRRQLAALAKVRTRHVQRISDLERDGAVIWVTTEGLDGHDLAEELAAGPLLPGRVQLVFDGVRRGLEVMHHAGVVHGALSPRHIFFTDTDDGEQVVVIDADLGLPRKHEPVLVDPDALSPYAAPEQLSGPATPASDVYALGAVVYEMLAGKRLVDADGLLERAQQILQGTHASLEQCAPWLSSAASAMVQQLLALDPARRPRDTGAIVLVPLAPPGAPAARRGWGLPPEPPPFRADDPVERELVAGIRRRPDDADARQVYADWLEGHGHDARAAFLRAEAAAGPREQLHQLARPDDASWRAVTSRPRIDKCLAFAFECPKRWDALAPTGRDHVRHCDACAKPVYFCTSVDEARARGARHECVAIDAALAHGVAMAAYHEGEHPPAPAPERIMMGAPIRDWRPPDVVPPPIPEPPPKGVVDRVRGWFRRKET